MVSIILIVIIVFVAYGGRYSGVMERPVSSESFFITILFAPILMGKIEKLLIGFELGETISLILSFFVSTLIFYILAKIILERIIKMAKHPHQGMDKFLGIVFRGLKTYLLLAMFILFYGAFSVDRLVPVKIVNQGVKNNFVNNQIKNTVEYYRYKAYSSYKGVKEAEVTDINKKSKWSGDARRKKAADYTPWTVNAVNSE